MQTQSPSFCWIMRRLSWALIWLGLELSSRWTRTQSQAAVLTCTGRSLTLTKSCQQGRARVQTPHYSQLTEYLTNFFGGFRFSAESCICSMKICCASGRNEGILTPNCTGLVLIWAGTWSESVTIYLFVSCFCCCMLSRLQQKTKREEAKAPLNLFNKQEDLPEKLLKSRL